MNKITTEASEMVYNITLVFNEHKYVQLWKKCKVGAKQIGNVDFEEIPGITCGILDALEEAGSAAFTAMQAMQEFEE